MTDSELLHRFVTDESEQAFAELVSRHVDLVYTVALRLVNGDPHTARDIVQTVFIHLARTARRLPAGVVLSGWLYRHTTFVAAKTVRTELRRRVREQKACEMSTPHSEGESSAHRLADVHEAIVSLGAADRDAIILRYLKQQDIPNVATALGISEAAARKRVGRAVEKLRRLLNRRNATVSLESLTATLTVEAGSAAPAGLAGKVAAECFSAMAAQSGWTTLLDTLSAINLKTVATAAVVASLVTVVVLQERERKNLAQQNIALSNAILASQSEPAPDGTSSAAAEASRSTNNNAELLRLRGEVAKLRRMQAELPSAKAVEPVAPPAPLANGEASGEELFPPGVVNFQNARLREVLEIYGEFAGRELDVATNVDLKLRRITLTVDRPARRSEVVSAIEQALGEQAGLAVALDQAGRALVTPSIEP